MAIAGGVMASIGRAAAEAVWAASDCACWPSCDPAWGACAAELESCCELDLAGLAVVFTAAEFAVLTKESGATVRVGANASRELLDWTVSDTGVLPLAFCKGTEFWIGTLDCVGGGDDNTEASSCAASIWTTDFGVAEILVPLVAPGCEMA
jgi:hypothetical protein